MSNLTILIDLDSTVADFDPYIIDLYNQKYPEHPINETEIHTDHMGFKNHPLHDPRYSNDMFKIMRSPGFFRNLPLISGASEAINEIIEKGYNVYFVTIPMISNPTCADDKYKWVKEHFGEELALKTILTHDKSLIKGDILIDDWPKVHQTMTPSWIHLLYNTKYNSHLPRRLRLNWETWEDDLNTALTLVGR